MKTTTEKKTGMRKHFKKRASPNSRKVDQSEGVADVYGG